MMTAVSFTAKPRLSGTSSIEQSKITPPSAPSPLVSSLSSPIAIGGLTASFSSKSTSSSDSSVYSSNTSSRSCSSLLPSIGSSPKSTLHPHLLHVSPVQRSAQSTPPTSPSRTSFSLADIDPPSALSTSSPSNGTTSPPRHSNAIQAPGYNYISSREDVHFQYSFVTSQSPPLPLSPLCEDFRRKIESDEVTTDSNISLETPSLSRSSSLESLLSLAGHPSPRLHRKISAATTAEKSKTSECRELGYTSIMKRVKSMPNLGFPLKSISFSADLEKVCVFEVSESPKTIPSSEIYSVQDTGDLDAGSISQTLARSCVWVVQSRNLRRVSPSGIQMVHLDDCIIDAAGQCLEISILVRNLAFEKNVFIVFTSDEWSTSAYLKAAFVSSLTPTQGEFLGIDRFHVKLDLFEEFRDVPSGEIIFAIQYACHGEEFWDNNQSENFRITVERPLRSMSPPAQSRIQRELDVFHLDAEWDDNTDSMCLESENLMDQLLLSGGDGKSRKNKNRSISLSSYAGSPIQKLPIPSKIEKDWNQNMSSKQRSLSFVGRSVGMGGRVGAQQAGSSPCLPRPDQVQANARSEGVVSSSSYFFLPNTGRVECPLSSPGCTVTGLDNNGGVSSGIGFSQRQLYASGDECYGQHHQHIVGHSSSSSPSLLSSHHLSSSNLPIMAQPSRHHSPLSYSPPIFA